ncbi:MAG: hypothetical protein AAGA38_12085 [Pseudomonadota bacterium]
MTVTKLNQLLTDKQIVEMRPDLLKNVQQIRFARSRGKSWPIGHIGRTPVTKPEDLEAWLDAQFEASA